MPFEVVKEDEITQFECYISQMTQRATVHSAYGMFAYTFESHIFIYSKVEYGCLSVSCQLIYGYQSSVKLLSGSQRTIDTY